MGYPVVIDDQLGLYAALGALELPTDVVGVPVTTCAWQQRMLGAFVGDRLTIGRLRQIALDIGASTAEVVDAAARPRSDRLDIADPRPLAIEIAKLRVTGMNQLAAETIATARHLGAAVRVGEGNHEGRLAELVLAARIDLAVWEPSTST